MPSPPQTEDALNSLDPPVSVSRSALMRRVQGKNSKPEMAVRRLAHKLGFRFRLHRRDLPGTPDLVFPGRTKVIFVHGCFWHRHPGCSRTTMPKTRAALWAEKFAANIKRDKRTRRALERAGWDTLVIWECETFNLKRLTTQLDRFLRAKRGSSRRHATRRRCRRRN
jgi:DNA mismatch endonuclease (patch repair protein)